MLYESESESVLFRRKYKLPTVELISLATTTIPFADSEKYFDFTGQEAKP